MATTLSSPPTPPVSPAELAELIAAFNEVTGRLQGTHEALRREVVRLQEELRDANEQLQRSKRLAALGQMAAGIAHEVRNPLGSIRLYARMLEQDLADRPAERAIASKIAAAVHGLDCVVGDVLNFSRELKVRPQETEPEAILDRALEACWTADAAAAQRIRVVRREASGGVSARLVCDPVLMHQALVNLIRNALEAMAEVEPPSGGHALTLEAGACRDEDGRVMFRLSVSDTGPGVTRDVVDRMFNPFFTTRAAGTGLGLAIVHRIIDAHAGRIRVRNNADAGGGRGATFTVLIPADPDPDAGAGTEAGKAEQEAMT